MKPTLTYLTFFLTAFAFVACTGSVPSKAPSELILGKWRFEKMRLPEAAKIQMNESDQAQFAMMQNQFQSLRYNFFKDGTYSLDMELTDEFGRNMQRGTYQLVNDGAILNTSPDASSSKDSKSSSLRIVLITADSLLLGEDDRSKADLIFLREKES